MEGIPHYMIDILPPDASFLHMNLKRAEKYIKDITGRGKVPIIAGEQDYIYNLSYITMLLKMNPYLMIK